MDKVRILAVKAHTHNPKCVHMYGYQITIWRFVYFNKSPFVQCLVQLCWLNHFHYIINNNNNMLYRLV